ncbi:hypothetical protein PT974_12318 [Cladobotryum mycophilum]|uniref:G-protein coupled receptors family 2 profile 2 domain-containing protein n=1 Tax=Cladobotryum mycophilum TaxID=491253 RepID=A0ABR0S7M8_9HYPO
MYPPEDDTSGSTLTPHQIKVLITIERAGAGLSMGAIALTVLSFIFFRKLRTTPNLFLVFASIANAGASIASMMGYDGLVRGENSALCQVQGFIFEWFMQSDPWWSFAMAVNVFLVFFCNADPTSFRKYIWVYCLICFGGPMIPAIVLVSIRDDPRGPIFGNAALWCWIGNNWSLVRLYAYYIPIWICILLSILIYVAVGFHVFRQRNQLRNIVLHGTKESDRTCSAAGSVEGDSVEENNLAKQPDAYATVITEVQVTSHLPESDSRGLQLMLPPAHTTSIVGRGRSWVDIQEEDDHTANLGRMPQPIETTCSSDRRPVPAVTVLNRLRAVTSSASLKLKQLDPIKMAYLRTSFIFGFAILITWIPSSINRVYSLTHDGRVSYHLSIASGCVLPLQGVWNMSIYFITSARLVREEFQAIRAKMQHKKGKGNGFGDIERLDSRLNIVGYENRHTFEGCRTSRKASNASPFEMDEVELDGRVTFAKSSI